MDNNIIKDAEECPHEFYNLDMKLQSALEKQSNGKWKCKFCGQEFDSQDIDNK